MEAEIIRTLLDGYDPRAFPAGKSVTLPVDIDYYLFQIQSLVCTANCSFKYLNLKFKLMGYLLAEKRDLYTNQSVICHASTLFTKS